MASIRGGTTTFASGEMRKRRRRPDRDQRDRGALGAASGEHVQSTPLVDVAWAVEWVASRTMAGAARRGPRPARTAYQHQRVHRQGSPPGVRSADRSATAVAARNIVDAARIARDRAQATSRVQSRRRDRDGQTARSSPAATSRTRLTASRCAPSVSPSSRRSPTDTVVQAHRHRRRYRSQPTTPCGACRQILWELAGNLEIVLADLHDVRARHSLKDLLPASFRRTVSSSKTYSCMLPDHRMERRRRRDDRSAQAAGR